MNDARNKALFPIGRHRILALLGLAVTACLLTLAGYSWSAPKTASGRAHRPRIGRPRTLARVLPPPAVTELRAGDSFRFAAAIGRSRALIGERVSGSPAIRMEHEGRWLQFVLEGARASRATLDGNEVTFKSGGGIEARYRRLDNEVKEELVLSSPPPGGLITFRFAQAGVKSTHRRDGFHFFDGKGIELFWVKNPTVRDAKGLQGGATLQIDEGRATIRLEDKFLETAVFPITVDPTIVSLTSEPSGGGLSINRHILRSSNGTLVFFYQSGTGIEFKTSTNEGSSWSAATGVSDSASNEVDVFMASDNIYVAYRGTANNDILFRKLTYAGGSSWNVGAEVRVETVGTEKRTPAIVREPGGRLWIVWHHRLGGTNTVRVRSSTNEGVTWSASTILANITLPDSCAMVLYQGRPAVVFELSSSSLQMRLWNGTAWTAAQAVVSGDDYDDANWGSLVTTSDGSLHLAYCRQGGGYIRYVSYDAGSWSAPLTLSDASGDRYPSITTDGTRLWVYWSRYVGPNQYKIVYSKYAGGWDTTPRPVTGNEENAFGRVLLQSGGGAGPGYSENLAANEYLGQGGPQGWRADDQSWNYTLPFPFVFYDTTRTTVNVCSNGFLDFTSADAEWNNTLAEMQTRVMICGMWDDIRTDQAGQAGEDIYIYQPDADSVAFRWVGQTYTGGYPVNMEIRLYRDGTIKFNYGPGNTNLTPTIGLSAGDGTHYMVSTYDGSSVLTSAQTSVMQPSPTGNWADRTTQAADTAVGDVRLFGSNGDAVYMGLPAKFDYVYFSLSSPAGASVNPTWEYWDGGSWQPLALTDNPAYGFTSSGRIGFSPPAGWQARSLEGGSELYYIRAVRQAAAIAPPVASQFTSVRNNIQPTTASFDTSTVPVGWSEGVSAPYSVRFNAIPLVEISLSIEATYDRDGTMHSSGPFGIDFGDIDPSIGVYTINLAPGSYGVRTRVISDTAWDLFAQGTDDLRDSDGNTIPIGNLRWALDGSGAWASFVKTPASTQILSDQAANFPDGVAYDFDYQLTVDWNTTGSNLPFATTLMYTAVQR